MAYELQQNFSSGEISPKMWWRNDYGDMYFSSTARMRNMLPQPWGPAVSRHGFEFIAEIEERDYGRLFPFNVSFSISFIVVVTEDTIFIADEGGFSSGDNIILNNDFDLGSTDWDVRGTVGFGAGQALLQPTGGGLASVRQEIGQTIGETYRLKIRTGGIESLTVELGILEGGDEVFSIISVGPEIIIDYVATAANHWLEMIAPAGAGSPDISLLECSIQLLSTVGDRIEFPVIYTREQLVQLQVDMVPDNKIMYMVTRGHVPMKLERLDTGEWTFQPVNFDHGVNPDPWANDDFPGTLAFHHRRMALGGTIANPVGIWLSKPGEFENFDQGDLLAQTPGDALFLPLDKNGEIQWLRSNKELFAGLDTGEHVIFGQNGPLDVDNAQTEQSSAYGSARVHALTVNEQTVYVGTQGRSVRGMDYQERSQSWVSNQLSFVAEHITDGLLIEASYGSAPFGIMWFVTLTGHLVSMSIEKDQNTLGWARHNTQGDVVSVAVVKESGVDTPWILVRRFGKLYLEHYRVDNFFLDSGKITSLPAPSLVFTGYEHLAGQIVQVLVDNYVHPPVKVGFDGVITLEREANTILAGYSYKCELHTLPKVSVRETGATFKHQKRYSEIAMVVLDSSRPTVNGEDTAIRFPATPMGEREPNTSEFITVSSLGFDKLGTIEVEMDLPLDLQILAIGGKLKQSAV